MIWIWIASLIYDSYSFFKTYAPPFAAFACWKPKLGHSLTNASGKYYCEKSNMIIFKEKDIFVKKRFSYAFFSSIGGEQEWSWAHPDNVRQLLLHRTEIRTLRCFIWIHVTFKWLQKCDKIKLTAYKVHIVFTCAKVTIYMGMRASTGGRKKKLFIYKKEKIKKVIEERLTLADFT